LACYGDFTNLDEGFGYTAWALGLLDTEYLLVVREGWPLDLTCTRGYLLGQRLDVKGQGTQCALTERDDVVTDAV
jgi:hypothetical protein